MSFAREGLPLIVIAALVAAGTYALALNRRSWPLWLLAFALTIAALCVAYFYSDPRQPPTGARRASVQRALAVHAERATSAPPGARARPTFLSMNEPNVPVDRSRVNVR